MTPSLTATLTETPTASPTWIETLVTTITGTALTPSPVSTDAPLGVPTIKPDDALATPTLGPTVTFPVMPGIELTPALAFPSPAALALDLEPEQPLPVLESTDFRDPHDVDWEFTEPVMEPSEDGTYWLHFRTPYAVRARLPDQNNVTLTLNLRMTGGRVSIRTHYTEGIGYYRFSLSADGLLELARGETVVASVRLVPVQPEHWRSLRLAVTGRSLRANIDGAMVLHYVDHAPLPPGQVWMAVDGIPTGEVWIDNVQMTGSTPRAEIAPPPIDMSAASMELSPFSTQPVVVFDRLMNATTGDHDLYRMNIAGGDYVALPNNTLGKEYEPVLSPDGKRIAFTSWRDGSTYTNNTNIWVMNSDGSGLWQVTNNAAFDYSPAWSPDGSRLAFVSNRGGVERVYVLYAGGSEVEGDQAAMISTGKDPAWSPDGTALVISALNTTTDYTWDLYLVDMTNYDYNRYHLLGEALRAELQPTWSADSSAVVFTSIIYNGTVPEYTLRRVLRYAPYTVTLVSNVKDVATADYGPGGSELIWRLDYLPTNTFGFSRGAANPPFTVTHFPVHNSDKNTFNPDWGIFVLPQQGGTPTPTGTPPMTGVWASDWVDLTYKYINGAFSHPSQSLGTHPSGSDIYQVGMVFEWLTMVPSSDHIYEYTYLGGMQFNFRGITVQSNGGSFRHRRGVIEWLYRSQQYCGITYAANWMPNYTANAAQICTYYLPGSTASIGGGASLVNGNSRGAFVPESMSMSNWGVNMRGTARVRYIYWSPPINTPTPPPLPPPGTNECAATISISSIEVFSAASVVAIGNGDTQQTPLRTLASGTQVVITAIHPNRQFARITYSVPGTLLTGWIRIRTSATTGTYVNIDAGLCLSDPRNTQSKVESLVNVGETLLSSLFPCTGTYLHDCQPARQYSGLLSSTPLVRIGDFASTSQGCATSRCPNSCGLWTTTATENLHCGTDFVITGDNPPNPNADRTTYVATVGGTYCYYSDFTHGINVREYMNAVSGKLTAGWYIWQYQFTHFDASTDRFTNNFYVAAGTTLGSYQQVGSSDQPHVHVVIKLFADDYDENLCSTGNGVTYLDWENPTSTIIFP